MSDIGHTLINALSQYLQRLLDQALQPQFLEERDPVTNLRMENPEWRALVPSEMETIRKLLADNSVTLASVQRGDFGAAAKAIVQEAFPFPGDPEETGVRFN